MTRRDVISGRIDVIGTLRRYTPVRSSCIALFALCLACGANDMSDQPSWKPQEMEVRLPDDSLPVAGREEEAESMEAYSRLVNPIAPTESSVKTGKSLFQKYCVPCHGVEAKGGGALAKYFGESPPLGDPSNLSVPDGFFYSAMRHGRGMMPALAEALSAEERWHVVNYLRRLQEE